jgi:hypothetical protein
MPCGGAPAPPQGPLSHCVMHPRPKPGSFVRFRINIIPAETSGSPKNRRFFGVKNGNMSNAERLAISGKGPRAGPVCPFLTPARGRGKRGGPGLSSDARTDRMPRDTAPPMPAASVPPQTTPKNLRFFGDPGISYRFRLRSTAEMTRVGTAEMTRVGSAGTTAKKQSPLSKNMLWSCGAGPVFLPRKMLPDGI